MRGSAALALVLALAASLAPPVTAQEWVRRRGAELQLLDKVTARVSVVKAEVDRPLEFGTLVLLVRACASHSPDEVPNAAAWVEVRDRRRAAEQQVVFRGWMFANTPAVSMLEHPVYDLRILSCQ